MKIASDTIPSTTGSAGGKMILTIVEMWLLLNALFAWCMWRWHAR